MKPSSSSYSHSPVSLPHPEDPILPSLLCIRKAFDDWRKNPDESAAAALRTLLEECIRSFSDDERYRDDVRFLKIWILYGNVVQDFKRVFKMMQMKAICQTRALLYEEYALFLIVKGDLLEAHNVYQLGISRNAEPIDRLKKMHSLFLKQVSAIAQNGGPKPQAGILGTTRQKQTSLVFPWSTSTLNDLLRKMDSQLKKYNGYYRSNKVYPGKVSLNSLRTSSRNKIIELGGNKYHIRGCSGLGGYAQVYKAQVDGNPDDVVALKVQKPAFPWEFYMYRQLDKRISDEERSSFGFVHKVHIYSDWSILVCNYLSHGTLQDAINGHLVKHKVMDEVLCMYYTVEMLRMLEALHGAGIIHGDFKPDNLLVRYARDDLTEDGFGSRAGPWREQGLCLVDWGRGIDVNLFPADTEFHGDCQTSGFRCIEMQEDRTWTYQVDTYGLCAIVHMMLHGQYMSIEKKAMADGSYSYQPKAPLKRYWNVDLWRNLFSTLLNVRTNDSDALLLGSLRKSFEDHLSSNRRLISALKYLLVKQKASLCSS